MRCLGRFAGASRSLEGNLVVSFTISDSEEAVEALKSSEGHDLVIEAKKYHEKRSLNANAYFWKLCDEIARVLGSDKDTIYLLQLSKYGVFVDVVIPAAAFDSLKDKFRYAEQMEAFSSDGIEMASVRCFFGSSSYDRKEMAFLIDGTVRDAKELKIDTWTQEEIDRLVAMWDGRK